jgi:hypothetical protein
MPVINQAPEQTAVPPKTPAISAKELRRAVPLMKMSLLSQQLAAHQADEYQESRA